MFLNNDTSLCNSDEASLRRNPFIVRLLLHQMKK